MDHFLSFLGDLSVKNIAGSAALVLAGGGLIYCVGNYLQAEKNSSDIDAIHLPSGIDEVTFDADVATQNEVESAFLELRDVLGDVAQLMEENKAESDLLKFESEVDNWKIARMETQINLLEKQLEQFRSSDAEQKHPRRRPSKSVQSSVFTNVCALLPIPSLPSLFSFL